MTDSRKNLLQLIYEHDQSVGGPLQIGIDGSDIGSDRLILRNDVSYLKDHGYIYEPTNIIRSYCLALTEKGEEFVESDFQRQSAAQTSFNFSGATISNATIGNENTVGSMVYNASFSLSDLEKLFAQRPDEEKEKLDEILELLHDIAADDVPVTQGTFSTVVDFIKQHVELKIPIALTLFNHLSGQS